MTAWNLRWLAVHRHGIAQSGIFLLALLLPLNACNAHPVDLAAVQQYVKATAEAEEGFAAVSDDLYRSCLRYQEYARLAAVGGRPLWSDVPTRKPEPTAPPAGAAPTALPPLKSDSDCHASSDLAYRWDMENEALLGYVHALGTVAGVDVMPANFDMLSSSLKGAGLIGDDRVATAAGNLAQEIAGSLIAARQRADVYAIARGAQKGGLDDVVSGIRGVVVIEYRQKLGNERQAVDEYYATLLQAETSELSALQCPVTVNTQMRRTLSCQYYPILPKRMTASQRAIQAGRAAQLRDLIRAQRAARKQAFDLIAQRKNAVNAYDAAISDIAKGNDAILKSPSGDVQALAQAVKPYAADLQDNVSALLAALKK